MLYIYTDGPKRAALQHSNIFKECCTNLIILDPLLHPCNFRSIHLIYLDMKNTTACLLPNFGIRMMRVSQSTICTEWRNSMLTGTDSLLSLPGWWWAHWCTIWCVIILQVIIHQTRLSKSCSEVNSREYKYCTLSLFESIEIINFKRFQSL